MIKTGIDNKNDYDSTNRNGGGLDEDNNKGNSDDKDDHSCCNSRTTVSNRKIGIKNRQKIETKIGTQT